MQPWNLAKLFLKIFALQAKPSDVPYSKTLLFFLSIVFLLTKSAAYMWFLKVIDYFNTSEIIHVSYFAALMVSVVWILILFASLRTTLLYYNLIGRFVQGATAFVAMDCLLTVVFLIWLTCLSLLEVPLNAPSLGSIGIILGLVLMMYWQFMVYIHLSIYCLDISLIKAGVFALFYMMLQLNLSEVLLNVVITVQQLQE